MYIRTTQKQYHLGKEHLMDQILEKSANIPVIHFDKINHATHGIGHALHPRDYINLKKTTHLSHNQNDRIPCDHWTNIETNKLKSYASTFFLPAFLGNNADSILVPKVKVANAYFSQFGIDFNHVDFPNSRSIIISRNLFNANQIYKHIEDESITKHIKNNKLIMAEVMLWSEHEEEFARMFDLTQEPANDSLRMVLPLAFKPYVENLRKNMKPYFAGKHQKFHPIDPNMPIIDLIVGNKFADVVGNKYTLSEVIYKDVENIKVYICPNMSKRGNLKYYRVYTSNNNNKLGFVISRTFTIPNKFETSDNLNSINFIKNVRDNYTMGLLERAKDEKSYNQLSNFLNNYLTCNNKSILTITLAMRKVYLKILDLNAISKFPFDVHKCRTILDLFPNGDNPLVKHYYDLFIQHIDCPENYAYFVKTDIYGNVIKTPTSRFYNILKYLVNQYEPNYSPKITEEFIKNITDEFISISKTIFKNFEAPRNTNNFYIEAVHTETPDPLTIFVPQCLIDMGYYVEGTQSLLTGNPIHSYNAVQIVTVKGWEHFVLGLSKELAEAMDRDFDGDQFALNVLPTVTVHGGAFANDDLFNQYNFGIFPTVTIQDGVISKEGTTKTYGILDLINTDLIIDEKVCKYSNNIKHVLTSSLSITDTVLSYLTAKKGIGRICSPTRVERSLAHNLETHKMANFYYYLNANFVINTKDINVLDPSFIEEANQLTIDSYQRVHNVLTGEDFTFDMELTQEERVRAIAKYIKSIELHEQFLLGVRNLITMTEIEYQSLMIWIDSLGDYASYTYKNIKSILSLIFDTSKHDPAYLKEQQLDGALDALISDIFSKV